jgi:hypothetical protein
MIAKGCIMPWKEIAMWSSIKTICENYAEAEDDLMFDYDDGMLLKSWGVLLGMSVFFMTITGILLEWTKAD